VKHFWCCFCFMMTLDVFENWSRSFVLVNIFWIFCYLHIIEASPEQWRTWNWSIADWLIWSIDWLIDDWLTDWLADWRLTQNSLRAAWTFIRRVKRTICPRACGLLKQRVISKSVSKDLSDVAALTYRLHIWMIVLCGGKFSIFALNLHSSWFWLKHIIVNISPFIRAMFGKNYTVTDWC